MVSMARKAFDSNCEDIARLLEIHADLGGSGPGRRTRLEVLNKSAIVLITAFWEAYCEDLTSEALAHLVKHAPDSSALSKELRQAVAKDVRASKHELEPWSLAGDGWRHFLQDRLDDLQELRDRKLNTPKTSQIDQLFDQALGISKVSSTWFWTNMTVAQASAKLDKYVELRGSIAHRGSAAKSVKKSAVTDYYRHVKRLVGKTGGRVNRVVKQSTGQGLW